MVMAASHARNAESYEDAGQAFIAKEERAAAERTMLDFRTTRPDWSIASERACEIFKHGTDRDHWLDGLFAAGLPEQ